VVFNLYLHIDPAIGEIQLQRRQERSAARQSEETTIVRLDDSVIIQILLILIRHPGSRPANVVRTLRGHSPPIGLVQVVEICLLSKTCGLVAARVDSQVHDITQLLRRDRCENHMNFS